ncbi:protein FAM83F isoform X2 [Denticeps clupeoides]|uniref:protein FAM83F isoform X2 n=1 Tax=Denticeps clupeoides TaxID=299321 RepID=UPI0010A4CB0F|nr:protein FAM83F-like isoform X2 [Denticeps clupeoides]
MAESQLTCMDDGHINEKIAESKPQFYYSEEQRVALEELLRSGDGEYKTSLAKDGVRDFLSAREIKLIRKGFREYGDGQDQESPSAATSGDSATLRSTYWPELSDYEVPSLDIGWPSGGFFRGVTRVEVYSHPPKENAPCIKELVRRMIQESRKVIAIVMDLLTDLHILQDLLEAAAKHVPVYIILDASGVPHFLDMCNRLQFGSQNLRNIRVRIVKGAGLSLSFGKLAGSLCSKYMLIDGDKVLFGSYSFSWCTSRMDRNTVTVMSGQVVEFFDHDFRELYAISDELNLYKEFHVAKPINVTLSKTSVGPKRPSVSVSTSRFQVALGDARQGEVRVPAHKYYNPKYLLALGNLPGPSSGSNQDVSSNEKSFTLQRMLQDQAREQIQGSTETLDCSVHADSKKKAKSTLSGIFKKKAVSGNPAGAETNTPPNSTSETELDYCPDLAENTLAPKGKSKKPPNRPSKKAADENGKQSKNKCLSS